MCLLCDAELGLELCEALFIVVVLLEVFVDLEGLQGGGILVVLDFLILAAEVVAVAFGFG